MPGLIFKPVRGKIFDTQEQPLELLAGNLVQNFSSYQDVFLMNKDSNNRLNIKTNPYTYPLNNRENYDFVIESGLKPNIFQEQNIFEEDYSSLNIIQTTSPSLLIGISSSGISFVNSGSITNLFEKTLFGSSPNANNSTLSFGQIRQNITGFHYDSSLNCSLFFTEKKSITDFIVNNSIKFTNTDGTIGVSPKKNISQLYNYGLNIDQSGVPNVKDAVKFYDQEDNPITVAGASPYMLGDNKLYIYYYFGSYGVCQGLYTEPKYFGSSSFIDDQRVSLMCQTDLQSSSGTCTIKYCYNNPQTCYEINFNI